jgi:hypothetical protein
MRLRTVRLVDARETVAPTVEANGAQICAEWTQRCGDRALLGDLDGLRSDEEAGESELAIRSALRLDRH